MKKLTDRQKYFLSEAAKHPLGLAPEMGNNNGLASASHRRMMRNLTFAGLFREYVHGGHEITAAGRDAISAAT